MSSSQFLRLLSTFTAHHAEHNGYRHEADAAVRCFVILYNTICKRLPCAQEVNRRIASLIPGHTDTRDACRLHASCIRGRRPTLRAYTPCMLRRRPQNAPDAGRKNRPWSSQKYRSNSFTEPQYIINGDLMWLRLAIAVLAGCCRKSRYMTSRCWCWSELLQQGAAVARKQTSCMDGRSDARSSLESLWKLGDVCCVLYWWLVRIQLPTGHWWEACLVTWLISHWQTSTSVQGVAVVVVRGSSWRSRETRLRNNSCPARQPFYRCGM